MKNKKKILIVCAISLIIILVGICCYFIFHKDKKVYKENNNKIVSKEEYLGYSLYSINNHYINNGNKYVAFDNKTDMKVAEFEIPYEKYNEIINFRLDIIKIYSYQDEKDNKYKLFNTKGELLKTSEEPIRFSNDTYNNKSYYIYENSLYDENNELLSKNIFKNIDISKDVFRFDVYGSYLIYINNSIGKILNLKNNKSIDIKSYFNNDKFVEIESKDNFYLLNLEKDELDEYTKSEDKSYGKILYKNEQKYVYTNSEIIKYEGLVDYEGYKLDFASCKDGFNISKNNELLSDECFYQYGKDKNNNIYLSNSKAYYLKNDKLHDKIPVGNYFINSYNGGNIIVYNDKDEQVSDICSNGFDYYRNELYVCNNGVNSYLVNSSFKKVTDSYDEIVCSDTYCKMFQNEKYGLLYNDKVVVSPTYEEIYFWNNAILAEDAFKLDYFLLGSEKFLSEDNLYQAIDEYKNINIDQIITEYNLKNIEKIIKENNDFFQKYAYVVLNNDSLTNFKKYVLTGFIEIAQNKEYLNEDYFLYSLKKLYIREKENLEFSGLYDFNVGINISGISPRNIFHEFTHFTDDRLNRNNFSSITIYKYNNKYLSKNEYELLSQVEKKNTEIKTIDFQFLAEAGAEIYMGIYLNNYLIDGYSEQVYYYNIFSYIYGSDFMRKVFFSQEGNYLLFKKMADAGYSFNEIEEFSLMTSPINGRNKTFENTIDCIEFVINLYEKEKEIKWNEDKIFSFFISKLIPNDLNVTMNEKYNEYKKASNYSIDLNKQIFEKIGNFNYDYSNLEIFYNNVLYIPAVPKISNENIIITYDIEKNEITSYQSVRDNFIT